MDFIWETQLVVPIFQIGLLLVLSTLSLLFGRMKLALLINYLFALYWGYIFNREIYLGSNPERAGYFTALYFGFGFVIVLLALIGFLAHQDD